MIIFIGWFGTLLYLVNHAYISISKNWQQNIYYTGNVVAAICLIISSSFSTSWQAVVINTFWAIISIAFLVGTNLNVLSFNKHFFYVAIFAMLAIFVGQLLVQNHLNFALLGWSSAFIFSGCFLLFSQGKMPPRSFLGWNAFAAVALLPQLWNDSNWPVFSLEIIWAAISIYGVARREKVYLL